MCIFYLINLYKFKKNFVTKILNKINYQYKFNFVAKTTLTV